MAEKPLHITLAGVKHCGKSTLGRLLAEKCGVAFIDSDAELERRHGKSTRELFRSVGEQEFRRLESEILSETAAANSRKGYVLSLGGGAVSNPFVTDELFELLGVSVMIDISDRTAAERVFADGVPAYLEKEPDLEAALLRINSQRKEIMRARCSKIYPALEGAEVREQVENFYMFLQQEGVL